MIPDLKLVPVTEANVPPAGKPGECFWCRQPVGGTHALNCSTVTRKVRVRLKIEYEVDVPQTWSEEDIEFHRNESSWCANNLLQELDRVSGAGCLCGRAEFEYAGEAEA